MRDPISDHRWGQSAAADRIWAQVSPIRRYSRPWERRFVVLQAFIDESTSDSGAFVLAGYVSPAERWAEFSNEWEKLLPLAVAGSNNKHRFKMSEMRARNRDVRRFYAVIEKYATFAVACKIDVNDLKRAMDRIWIDGMQIDFSYMGDPYFLSFWYLLDNFHRVRQPGDPNFKLMSTILPIGQKVDFYFDEHSRKNAILQVWDPFLEAMSEEARALYGHMPRFENDDDFLPLQAADFWAWWVRKGYEDCNLENSAKGKLPTWNGTKPISGMVIEYSEDQIVASLMTIARGNIAMQHGETARFVQIYDSKYHPRPGAETEAPDGLSPLARFLRWVRGNSG